MQLITKNDEIFTSFIRNINEADNAVSEIVSNYKPSLGGEKYLTDKELSKLLKISRRTLQDYRSSGKIPYFMIGGKALYRESDIEKLLVENYCPKKDGY